MAASKLKASKRPAQRSAKPSLTESRTAAVGGLLVLALALTAGLLYVISPAPLQPDGSRTLSATEVTTTPGQADPMQPVFDGIDVPAGRWTTIQVRHSGESFGNVNSLAEQAQASGQTGVPDHFVITNGNGGGDGELFMTARWDRQLPSIHPWAQPGTVTVCVVGDLDQAAPSPRQAYRLNQLLAALQERTGASNLLADAAVRRHLQAR